MPPRANFAPRTASSPGVRYGAAAAFTSSAFVARLILDGPIASAMPVVSFFPAVMLSAWFGGLGPGLLATLLGALFTWQLSLQSLPLSVAILGLVIYSAVGILASYLIQNLHDARFRADESLRNLQQAHQRTLAAEQTMSAVIGNVSDGVLMVDAEGRCTEASDRALAILRTRRAEIVGRKLTDEQDLIPGSRRVWGEPLNHALQARSSARWEGYCPDPELWYEASAHPSPTGTVIYLRDITEQRWGERELRSSESRFRELVSTIEDVFWIGEPDTQRCLYVSPSFEKVWGMPSKAVLADWQAWLRAIHPEDREFVRSAFMTIGDRKYDVVYRIMRSDGEQRWIHDSGYAVRGAEGSVRRIVGVARDITAAKETELRMARSERRYRSLVEASAQVVWATSGDGNVVEDLPSWRKFTGQTVEEMMGQGWAAAVHPDDIGPVAATWQESLRTGKGHVSEFRIRSAGGDWRYVQARAVPLLSSDGTVQEWIGTCMDLTEQKRAEAERDRLLHELEIERARLQSAAAQMPSGLIIAEAPSGRLLFRNAEAEKLLGAAVETLNLTDCFPALRHAIEAGGTTRDDEQTLLAGGTPSDLLVSCAPIRDDRGALVAAVLVFTDIGRRKAMENALRAREHELSTIVNNIPDLICRYGPDLRYSFVSPVMDRYGPNRAAEFLGKTHAETGLPEDLCRLFDDGLRHVFATGEPMELDYSVPLPSGTVYFRSKAIPEIVDGQVVSVMTVSHDVTAERQASEALRASEERYRSLTHATSSIVWVIDAEGRFIPPQTSWTDYTGQPAGELAGGGGFRMVHPEDIERLQHAWQQAYRERKEFTVSYRLWHAASGGYRQVVSRGVPVLNADGSLREFVGAITDVHEQHLAEQARRQSEERLQLAAEIAELGVFDWNIESEEAVCSARMREICGVVADEPVSAATLARLISPEDIDRVSAAAFSAMQPEGDGRFYAEFRIHRPDGAVRWLLANGRAFFAEEHRRPVRFVGTVLDTTTQKQAAEELSASNTQLRQANEELEQFAWVASHDMREPLRTVNLYTQLLLARLPDADPEIAGFAQYINSGVQRMQSLIRDLLSYSRVLHSEVPDGSAVDLDAACSDAIAAVRQSIEDSDAVIELQPLPLVCGDRSQLALVFQNLISNAIKYRRAGIQPRVSIGAEESGDGMWIISVSDNGMGFQPQYAERIFGLFKRLHGEEIPGTGLGLAICRRIVERYGGQIWAESEPGAGATFRFRLRSAAATLPISAGHGTS